MIAVSATGKKYRSIPLSKNATPDLKNKNESNITSTLNISQQTLKIQKFNIMYKLKLRRMSDIVTLGITSYF